MRRRKGKGSARVRTWKCPITGCNKKWRGIHTARCPEHSVLMEEK